MADPGTPEQHKGCKAPEALASGQAVHAPNPEKDTSASGCPSKATPTSTSTSPSS